MTKNSSRITTSKKEKDDGSYGPTTLCETLRFGRDAFMMKAHSC